MQMDNSRNTDSSDDDGEQAATLPVGFIDGVDCFSTVYQDVQNGAKAFERLCMDWRNGALRDPRAELTRYIKRFADCNVRVGWPPGCVFRIGGKRRFGITGFGDVVNSFPCTVVEPWCRFIGLMHTDHSVYGLEFWIIVSARRRVFGFHKNKNMMYELSRELESFFWEGARVVPDYYNIYYRGEQHEIEWFGHDPSYECTDVMDADVSDDVLTFVRENPGLVLGNCENSHIFILGGAAYLGLHEIVPEAVLRRLTDVGFEVIGKTTIFQRVLLLDVSSSDVYVLMSHGFVFKVADGFAMLLRNRLDTLRRAQPTCFQAVAVDGKTDTEFEPVGSQRRFAIDLKYDLPGDKELLSYWVTRFMRLEGWPQTSSVDVDYWEA